MVAKRAAVFAFVRSKLAAASFVLAVTVAGMGSVLAAGATRGDAVPSFVATEAQRFARDFGSANRKATVIKTTYGRYKRLGPGDAPIGAVPDGLGVYVVRLTGDFVSYGPCVRANNYPARRVRVVDVLIDAESRTLGCWNEEPTFELAELGEPLPLLLERERPREFRSATSVPCLRKVGSVSRGPAGLDAVARTAAVAVRVSLTLNVATVLFADSETAARRLEARYRGYLAASVGDPPGGYVERKRNVVVLWKVQPGRDPARWVRECLLV